MIGNALFDFCKTVHTHILMHTMGLKRKLFPESSTGLIPDDLMMQVANRKGNSFGSSRTKKTPKESGGLTMLTGAGDSLATIHGKTRRAKGEQTNDETKNPRQTKERKKATSIKTPVTELLGNQQIMVSNSIGGGMLTCLGGMQQSRSSKKKRTRSKSGKKRNAKQMAGRNSKSKNGESLLTSLFKASMTDENSAPRPVNAQHITEQLTKIEGNDEKQREKPFNQRAKATGKRGTASQSRITRASISKASNAGRKPNHKIKKGTSPTIETCGLGAFVGMTTKCRPNRNSRKQQPVRRFVSPLEGNAKNTSGLSSQDEGILPLHPGIINETATSNEVPAVILVPISRESDPSIETGNSMKDNQKLDSLNAEGKTATPSEIEIEAEAEQMTTTPREGDSSIATASHVKDQRQLDSFNPEGKTATPSKIEVEQMGPIPREKDTSIETAKLVNDQQKLDSLHSKDEAVASSKLQKEQIAPYLNPVGDIETKSKQGSNYAVPENQDETEKKESCPKYDAGTKFAKYFRSFGWFRGTVVAFNCESGFYCVSYEDGDSEELEESELDRCKIQTDDLVGTNDDKQLNGRKAKSRIEVANVSVRKSKRRRSQPDRLVYTPCAEDQNTSQSTGKRRRKSAEQKPKQITVQEDEVTNRKNKSDGKLCQNMALLPSGHVRKNPKKEEFDDALRALMPVETEDDIFNSTPMRTLFMRKHSEDWIYDSKVEDKQDNIKPGRRSKRKSIEPEWYVPFALKSSEKQTKPVHSASKSCEKTRKSLLKKRKSNAKSSSKAKKRVRISINRPQKKGINSDSLPKEVDPWTQVDLRTLHKAHRTVDPTSFSYWEDVAEIVGEKSATECREKWFSLAKTPEPKRPKPKKNDKGQTAPLINPRNIEDDIFNSTPMRSAFGSGDNIDVSGFEELGDISSMNVGSVIKINRLNHSNDKIPQTNNERAAYPLGYKTYLQNIGRSMRQKDHKQNKGDSIRPPLQFGKKLTGRVNEGDVEVKCRLSPGGTLQVDTYGDTDTEGYLDDDEDDDAEDEVAGNF
eukprot:jgi/Psemu1/292890/fgenesh1_pg.1412_\